MRKVATHFLIYVVRTYVVIVAYFFGKEKVFRIVTQIPVFIQVITEWERNTLEIMFQLKYVSHDPNFAKITEKMHFPLSRGDALENQTFLVLHPLGCIKRKLYPIKIHQTSANCLTSLCCCRKTSYVL